jgi:hydrogenase-4 component E
MVQLLDSLLIGALVINFIALGVSRLRALIFAVAVQGVLFGIVPLLVHTDVSPHHVLLAAAAVVVKGFIIPALLFRALRQVSLQREVEPYVGFIPSLLLGAVGTGLALVFASSLQVEEPAGSLLVPAAFSTGFTGFLILTTRRKAITQVVGFLMLENGIFAFGSLLLKELPLLVELGGLLDLFTGVFVMGIIIHHINREFDSVSTAHLAELKD